MAQLDDLAERSASELAAGIRARRYSATDILAAFLERIDRLNPPLNAICHLDRAGAMRAAARADAAVARGDPPGALHGVPMLLKDSHRVAGMPTIVGNPSAPHDPARTDGAVAARLRAAGTIIIGKTNAAKDLADFQTDNAAFGRTNNPWDLARTPGGSSGGAAAAVAARLTPVEVGSDIAGSIRVPAHFTGVFGLKPTAGAISAHGHVTEPTRHRRGGGVGALATIGPLARNPDDLDLMLDVLAPSEFPRFNVERSATIGILPTLPDLRAASSIRDAVIAAGSAAEHLGFNVELVDAAPVSATQHATYVRVYDAASRLGSGWRHRASLVAAQAAVRATWDRLLLRHDAIILPVAMCTAFTHRPKGSPIEVDGVKSPYWGLTRFCEPFNLTGHPAIVVPFGRDRDGMPIGIQIVARHYRDRWLIRLAALLAPGPPAVPPRISTSAGSGWDRKSGIDSV